MFQELRAEAQGALNTLFPDAAIALDWQVPRASDHGDLSTSVVFSLSKKLRKNPQDIARMIAEALSSIPSVERSEVAGKGYVNLWLRPSALIRELQQTRTACTAKVAAPGARPVIVEYSQPNIAKPLGIHHILSTIIGQAIANLNRHCGNRTVSINHLGDWGTQFGKIAVAMQRWGEGKSAVQLGLDGLLELYVRFHEAIEKEPTLEEEGRAAFKRLEEGDPAMRCFWKEVIDVTLAALQPLYERLGVSFDEVQGESFYEDKMQPVLEEGKKKGIFREGEGGALIVEFPEHAKLPPFMVLKGDGATLYATRDLATVRYRIDRWHPIAVFYVVDVAQQLYFQQLFATVQFLGWNVPHLEHVVFGRMRFADRSMSTRKGNILKLEDVLDEAVRRADQAIEAHRDTIQTDDRRELSEMMGIGALVYGILSQNRKMDIVFDWEKMLSFEGNSAPYLQYTHARARSVLRRAEVSDTDLPFPSMPSLTEGERLLLRSLLLFPRALEEALESRMPHKLATYLYELCQCFNAFYNTEPILNAGSPERELRLALSQLTAAVLQSGAGLLTLRVPDRM